MNVLLCDCEHHLFCPARLVPMRVSSKPLDDIGVFVQKLLQRFQGILRFCTSICFAYFFLQYFCKHLRPQF